MVFSSSSSAKSAQAIFRFSNWLSRLHVDMSCVCAYWGLTCWHSLHLIRWDELTDDVEEGICLVGALLNVLKGARTEALLSSACISVSDTNEVRDSDILKQMSNKDSLSNFLEGASSYKIFCSRGEENTIARF